MAVEYFLDEADSAEELYQNSWDILQGGYL